MCNPKKVMIHLTRTIEEAWRRTVEEAATATEEVEELGRITAEIPLEREMGPMALEMLEEVLANGFEGFEPWDRDSLGHYRRNLEDTILVFNPETGRLTVEAQLTEQVSAEARATAEAAGFSVGEVAVEAVGRYYEDGWGGRTKERAEEEARELGERLLDKETDKLHRSLNPEAFAQAEARARNQADELAREELENLKARARESLRERLGENLYRSEERVRHTMNRAVGEAYRLTLHRVVAESGGRILADEKTGSVINMEMELY